MLLIPSLGALVLLYAYPLALSILRSFQDQAGAWTLANFAKAYELYTVDTLYTVGITSLTVAGVFVISIALAGYLRFRDWPALNFLYRIPLFIPFLIVGHAMRVFLAPHGILNLILSRLTGIEELPGLAFSWIGLTLSYIWKQFPFATLLILGGFQSVHDSYIEAARNSGAGAMRIVFDVLLPMARPTVLVALILTFVQTIGALSIPLLVGSSRPVMLPVDMAFRVTYFNDWGTANALGVISYVIVIGLAIYYLRYMVENE